MGELATDFIERLLKVNMAERMTAHEAMCHPWLRSEAEEGQMRRPTADEKKVMKAVSKQNLRNDLVLSLSDKRLQFAIGSHLLSVLDKDSVMSEEIISAWSLVSESERLREL